MYQRLGRKYTKVIIWGGGALGKKVLYYTSKFYRSL